jgi:chromosome segregation ATPase
MTQPNEQLKARNLEDDLNHVKSLVTVGTRLLLEDIAEYYIVQFQSLSNERIGWHLEAQKEAQRADVAEENLRALLEENKRRKQYSEKGWEEAKGALEQGNQALDTLHKLLQQTRGELEQLREDLPSWKMENAELRTELKQVNAECDDLKQLIKKTIGPIELNDPVNEIIHKLAGLMEKIR